MIESRPGSVSDVDAICRLWNVAHPNSPRDPRELRRDFETLADHLKPEFLIAELEGCIVGFAEIGRGIGSFHPDRWECHVLVDPTHRRKGVGTFIADLALNALEARDPLSISAMAWETEPEALKFASRRGFSEVKRDFESLLDVAQATLPSVSIPDGYEFRSAADAFTDDTKREWHNVFEQIRLDIPRAYPATPLDYEFFATQVLGDPTLNLDATTLAFREGALVGFTGVFNGVEEGWLDQWLTGVVRPHRRRGVSLALKCHVIKWAKEHGIRTIRTDNDTRNLPMLAINEVLGFVPQSAIISLERIYRSETSPLLMKT
ncbi:MAG TPA: GNAT family N-acetyltransferase [Fimbriimonadaceae bacterium]|nr:GNAT family N-acetyltransferase [Fimbriimonadaceae bacterium]